MGYLPTFVDEFSGETGKVTGCVPAAGLMGVNKTTHGSYPATAAEREALQSAMGTQDLGANEKQLAAGILSRYGLTVTAGAGWATIAAALRDPAQGVAIFGSYKLLPLALRQHGRQPTFAGLHALYAQCLDPAAGTVIIGDPLATSYYAGLKVADLSAYSAGLGNLFAIFKEDAMTTITRTPFDPPRRVTIAGPRTVQSYDALTLAKARAVAIGPAGSSTSCDAYATIAPAPAWAPGGTVLHIASGPLVGYIAHWRNSGTLLKDAPAPPAIDCASAVKAATDPLIRRIADIQRTVAAAAAEVAGA